MLTRDFPAVADSLADSHGLPVDLAAVKADDALLDVLGDRASGVWPSRANKTFAPSAEAAVHAVLVAWRCDVDSGPELVDTDEAVAWIGARQSPKVCGEWVGFAAAVAVSVVAWVLLWLVLAGVR